MSKKIEIKCGVASCTTEYEEAIMWSQFGKYMLVGFADLHSKYRMPVWRKVD
jgi:hypothetical protein